MAIMRLGVETCDASTWALFRIVKTSGSGNFRRAYLYMSLRTGAPFVFKMRLWTQDWSCPASSLSQGLLDALGW
jgi:hypothetical protein